MRLCLRGDGVGGGSQVRDNILFGCAYDAQRYEMVLEACALKSVSSVCLFFCLLFFFQLFNFSTYTSTCFLLFVSFFLMLSFYFNAFQQRHIFFTASALFPPEITGQLVVCPGHALESKRRFCVPCYKRRDIQLAELRS